MERRKLRGGKKGVYIYINLFTIISFMKLSMVIHGPEFIYL